MMFENFAFFYQLMNIRPNIPGLLVNCLKFFIRFVTGRAQKIPFFFVSCIVDKSNSSDVCFGDNK